MRIYLQLSLVLLTVSAFGQKEIKKALIYLDSKSITYKEYKEYDLTGLSDVTVLADKEAAVNLFGQKAKNGVVLLRTNQFKDSLKIRLESLKKEIQTDGLENKFIVLNGVPVDQSDKTKSKLLELKFQQLEWITFPKPTDIINKTRTIVIQTNVVL
jgi:hypothetical protein